MQFVRVMQSLRLALVALCLAVPVGGHAATVIADGKEWRQVTETAGVSWNTLAASCDTGTGVCGGAYDGWTWASSDEVVSLFQSFIGPSFTGYIEEFSSSWAPAFLSQFQFTNEVSGVRANYVEVEGLTRTLFDSSTAVSALMVYHISTPFTPDRAQFLTDKELDFASSALGGWMYVTAPIPEPEIYAMMGLGLGLMGWAGRRKRLKDAQSA